MDGIDSSVDIVLFLTEGYNFDFLTYPFLITATLDNKHLETYPLTPASLIKINSELVWTTKKNNLRAPPYDISIHLNFSQINPDQKRIPFGYASLQLASARYLPQVQYDLLTFEELQVCGLSPTTCNINAKIKFNLRIQDTSFDIPPVLSAPNVGESSDEETAGLGVLLINHMAPKRITIGVSVQHETQQPLIMPEAGDFCLNEASAHLKENEKSEEDIEIIALHCYNINIDLLEIHWRKKLPPVHFRFHHPRAEITSSSHPELLPNTNLSNSLKNISAQLRFVECPKNFDLLLKSVPPLTTICTFKDNKPQVIGKAPLTVFDRNENTAELTDILSEEVLGIVSYRADITPIGVQKFHYCHLRPRTPDSQLIDRIIDELTAWKEKERIKLETEFNKKSEAEARNQNYQLNVLCNELKLLMEKLSKMEELMRFYKEQWTRAINKIHRIKTDGRLDLEVELPLRKSEVKELGLEESGNDCETSEKETERLQKLVQERNLLMRNCDFDAEMEKLNLLNRDIYKILNKN